MERDEVEEKDMAAGTLNLNSPRDVLGEAIVAEIRSWAEFPRRIFTEVHYAGKNVEDIAASAGRSPGEVTQILKAHESRLRRALRAFRIG